MTQKLGKTLGLFKDTSFVVFILNREFNLRAERRMILYFTRFVFLNETPPRKIYDAGGGLEKSQKAKTNSIVFDIARKGRNSVLYNNFAQEFVPMKRSQGSSSLNPF